MAPFHSYIKLPGSSDEKTSSPQRGFHSVSRFLFSTVGDTWLRCKAVVAWQQLWNGGWVFRATHTTSPPNGAGTCGANIHHIAGIWIGYGSKCLFTKWTSTCTLFWQSKCTRVLNHTSSSTWLKETQQINWMGNWINIFSWEIPGTLESCECHSFPIFPIQADVLWH